MWKLIEKVFHYIIRISTIKTVENFHSTFVLHIRNIQILSMLPRVYSCEESPETVSICFLRIIWIIIDPMFYWEIFEKKLWRRQNFFLRGNWTIDNDTEKIQKIQKKKKIFIFFDFFTEAKRAYYFTNSVSTSWNFIYINERGSMIYPRNCIMIKRLHQIG